MIFGDISNISESECSVEHIKNERKNSIIKKITRSGRRHS